MGELTITPQNVSKLLQMLLFTLLAPMMSGHSGLYLLI